MTAHYAGHQDLHGSLFATIVRLSCSLFCAMGCSEACLAETCGCRNTRWSPRAESAIPSQRKVLTPRQVLSASTPSRSLAPALRADTQLR